MAEEMTAGQAALALGVTPARVRQLLGSGELAGRTVAAGRSVRWRVDTDAVRARARGRDTPTPPPVRSDADGLEAAIAALQHQVVALATAVEGLRAAGDVNVREAALRALAAGDLMQEADAHRSAAVTSLAEAVLSNERAAALQADALRGLRDALAQPLLPGTAPGP